MAQPVPADLAWPMVVLAVWTLIVLALVPIVRARSAMRREVSIDDFRVGESARVPERVSLANRNYMNLLELPLLFYVACLLLLVLQAVTSGAVIAAWCFVVLRIVHSAIHLTYNHVLHRLAIFSLSILALLGLWILVVARLTFVAV